MNILSKIRGHLAKIFGAGKFDNPEMTEVEVEETLAEISASGSFVSQTSFDAKVAELNTQIDELKAQVAANNKASDNEDFSIKDALAELKTSFEAKLDSLKTENEALKTQISDLSTKTGDELNSLKVSIVSADSTGKDNLPPDLPNAKQKNTDKVIKSDAIDDMLKGAFTLSGR